MNISIVIPNYNGEEILKNNLPKVIEVISQYDGGKIEFVVVDDGSTDRSLEIIKNEKSKIKNENLKFKILLNSRNMGFSSTVNRGVKESMGEIIILLNTDVIPQKNFLESLLANFNNPNVFAVGCMDKSVEGDKIVLRGRGIGRWEKGFLVHKRGEVDKKDTLWVNGGSGAFRKSIWDKIGGFNEFYNPFYWEDIDLSYRAQKMGYKVLFEAKSIVFHEHQKGIIKRKFSASKIKTVAYRNQIIFVWLNITDLDWQFQHLFWLPYHLFKSLIRRNWEFLIGFFQALILLPKIIKTSFAMQKLFIKKDKEIIGEFLE